MSEESPSKAGRLVVVDDEAAVARVISTFFTREGWEVHTFTDPTEALSAMASLDFDVVLSDLSMPGMTGTELLQAMRERGYNAPMLVITAYGTVDSAVQALKLGVFDYLCKPFELENVKLAVQRAHLHRQLQKENEHLRRELQQCYKFGNLIGSSPRMLEIYELIEKAARSHATVLLLGESGTGKELVARALHYNSSRSNKRFVAVSCAALPNELLESELFGHEKGSFTGAQWQRIGRFELADGGTLFLDEIGDISQNVQTKMLRVLQEREIDRVGGSKPIKVDVRLVSATNRDLPDAIAKGEFREDLYYRLRVVEINLPPLRERKEDIPLLAKHFLDKFAKRDGKPVEAISDVAMEALESWDWPGNIRELENAIEHGMVMAGETTREISVEMLPVNLHPGRIWNGATLSNGSRKLADAMAEAERTMLINALDEANWDMARAADTLGITLRSMAYSVKKHNLAQDKRTPVAAGS
jgi:DNA-binding NtrC family response regulator